MTDDTAIKQLRAMVSRLSDALDTKPTHSGIPWRKTPLGQAASKLLAETGPARDDGGQQTLLEVG